jgi:glycosyltransferase involved in cell wall biosynthesis
VKTMSETPEQMPDNATDRPLVTFALFAYNQEDYIREAIEGAFAQTYQPLEIILSDDCSGDRTYEIMKEMAKEYDGPHRVILNRLDKNIGTIDHVLRVGRKAEGQLVVVAAGDDISLPCRTMQLADVWAATNAAVLYSGCLIVDSYGNKIRIESNSDPIPRIQHIFSGTNCARRYNGIVRNIPGYSAAYTRKFLTSLPESGLGVLSEDFLATIMANIQSLNIQAVELPLVIYRSAPNSVSQRNDAKTLLGIVESEKKLGRYHRLNASFFPYLLKLIRSKPDPTSDLEMVSNRLELLYRQSTLSWQTHEVGFLGRIALLARCQSLNEFKIVGSRLMGVHTFAIAKLSILKFSRRLKH